MDELLEAAKKLSPEDLPEQEQENLFPELTKEEIELQKKLLQNNVRYFFTPFLLLNPNFPDHRNQRKHWHQIRSLGRRCHRSLQSDLCEYERRRKKQRSRSQRTIKY